MEKNGPSTFRDSRLDKVFSNLVEQITVRYTTVIDRLSDVHSEKSSFYRFLNNPKVTPKGIIEEHWHQSSVCLSGKHILVVGDTSFLSFPANENRKGLGYIGANTDLTGFGIHCSLLVDADTRANYGIAGVTTNKVGFPKKKESAKEKKARKRAKALTPFQEKERYKWLSCAQQAVKNASGADRYTFVGDRESDIYDVMVGTLDQGHDFLYRCRVDRRLGEDENHQKLFEVLEQQAVQHRYNLDLPATQKRSEHTAELFVRFTEIVLPQPKSCLDKTLTKKIKVSVVEVKENPKTVVGKEKPVHWILLTSHPIENVEKALQIIEWYRWRWTIEQLFRTIKLKGLAIEQSQLETYEGLANLAALALIAASQVMQLVESREGQTTQELKDVFFPIEKKCLKALNKKLEGKTEKLKNPYLPNSLAFGSWVIARLGGWSGYKSERPPGPITMYRGLIKFYNILEGYNLRL